MRKVEKLTKEQEELIPIIRDKWIGRLNRCERIVKKKAKKGVNWLYRFSGLDEPKIIFVDSPLAAQYAVQLLKSLPFEKNTQSQVGSQVESQVWSQVENQVRSQVGSQVESQVGSQVENQVESQVGSQVWNQVRSQVENQVWNQVWSQVGSQVENQVENQVRSQVWNQVWNQVRSQVWKLKLVDFAFYGIIWDYRWISFYDFFSESKIIKKYDCEEFKKFKELIESNVYDMIQLESFCIVCSLPNFIKRDPTGRLHCLGGPAIKWNDGYYLNFLDGVFIDYDVFELFKNKKLSAKEVLNIKNIEQRYVLLKYLGGKKLLEELDAELINSTKKGNKLYCVKGIIPDKEVKLLAYSCPSSLRFYVKFVPFEMVDADEAQAWSHNMSKEEYNSIIQES